MRKTSTDVRRTSSNYLRPLRTELHPRKVRFSTDTVHVHTAYSALPTATEIPKQLRTDVSYMPLPQEPYVHDDLSMPPTTLKQALARPDGHMWKQAYDAEMDAMQTTKVFDVVQLPPGAKAIGCKLVFDVKRDGRYKVRLVAQGFSQRLGQDYDIHDTFSPVVSWPTLRAFWAICAKEDLEMRQLDVTTAFLNAPLEEVIYMKLPPGFAAASNAVLRLWKALYGLKQANKQWHKRLCRYLVAHGWTPSNADPSLWILQDKSRVIAAFYVDDCQLAAKKIGRAHV